MKTRTSVAPRPTHLSESEWYRRIEELSSGCKSVEVFHFQGLYFAGSIIGTIKAYLQESPSVPFLVWLIDSGLEIKQATASK